MNFVLGDDRAKLEQLINLNVLILDNNPLGQIPSFNLSKIQTLSLDGTSLSSASFPSSFSNSLTLKKLTLSQNRIRTLNENDFKSISSSRLDSLTIDNANLESIDPKTFLLLTRLQSLSLNKNLLKSAEFISNLKVLSSIKLDENQFSSLPEELILPHNIKTFSFKQNFITKIDENSPLAVWEKKNLTNLKIFLANNSFDCCESLWFIKLLKTTSFVADASILTCAKPTEVLGKKMISLNPDDVFCGEKPTKNLWLIITVSILGGFALIFSVLVVVFLVLRSKRSRTGYTEIGGVDDPHDLPTGPVFPTFDDDDDDNNERQTIISSIAPTIIEQV